MTKMTIYVVLALSVWSCTGKDTIVRPHEQKKPQDVSQMGQIQPLSFMTADVAQIQERFLNNRSNADLILQDVILPLESQLINVRRLSDPNTIQGDYAQWLNLYTEALLKAAQLAPENTQVRAAVDRFVNLSMTNCTSTLRECSIVNALKVSSNSSQILIWKANQLGQQIDRCVEQNQQRLEACNTLVAEKYRLLLHSENLESTIIRNNEFNVSYLAHANLIQNLPATSFIKQRHPHLFSTIIGFFDPLERSSQDGCSIVKRYGTWTYSQKSQENSSAVARRLFELSAMCDMYDGSQLSSSFQQAINSIQLNQIDGTSFHHRLRALTEVPDQRVIFSRYGLDGSLRKALQSPLDFSFYNEYFFVFDRLYNGHISYADAQQILGRADRNYENMIEVLEIYARLQIVAHLIETKIYLKGTIFNENFQNISSKIFERAIQDSTTISSNWKNLLDMMTVLRDATKTIVDQRALIQPSLRTKFQRIFEKIRYLPTTVKIMATYPAMMSLAHMLAEDAGTVSFRTWWGTTINQSDSVVYDNLWKGTTAPWFDLGDLQPINKFYLLYAFDYAIKSDFISLQKNEGGLAGTEDLQRNYMQVLFAKYLGIDRADLETMFSAYINDVEKDPMGESFQVQCDYELTNRQNQIPPTTRAVEDLVEQIYGGFSRGAEINPVSPALVFFERAKPPAPATSTNSSTGQNINENKPIFTHIFDKMFPKLQLAKVLRDIAERNGMSRTAIAVADEEIRKTEEQIARALRHFYSKVDRYSQCLKRVALVENYYHFLVYEAEKSYLRTVWREMKSLQGLEGDALNERLRAINDQVGKYRDSNQGQASGSDPHRFYFDQMSATSFIYTRYDFIMRLVRHLTTGSLEQYDSGPVSEMRIEHERRFARWMNRPLRLPRQWNILMPETDLRDWPLVKEPRRFTLNWIDDEEAFVRQGLRALKGDEASFVKWYSKNNTMIPLIQTLEMRNFLYLTESRLAQQVGINTSLGQVFDEMRDLLSFTFMTPHEAQFALSLGYESKMPLNEQKDILIDTNLRESLHPFTYLYNIFRTRIGMDPGLFNRTQSSLSTVGTVLADAYLLSKNLNDNLFILQFDTHQWIDNGLPSLRGEPVIFDGLKSRYMQLSHHYLRRLNDFMQALRAEPGQQYSSQLFRIQDGTVKTLEQANLISLNNLVVHPQRLRDMELFISDFTKYTENLYQTENLFTGER